MIQRRTEHGGRLRPGRWIGAALLILVGVLPVGALAYRVQPLIVQLAPSGAGSATKLVLSNTEATPITLELTPLAVTVGEDGVAVRVPEDEDILVFPPQTIIPPGREQVVQLRYVGAPDIAEAAVYAVRISQLPVTVPGTQPGGEGVGTDLKVGVDFISHVIVQGPDMVPDLRLGAAIRAADGSLRVPVRNEGDGVVLGADLVWTLTDEAGATVEVGSDAAEVEGFGALLADGALRTAVIAPGAAAGLSGDVSVTVRRP